MKILIKRILAILLICSLVAPVAVSYIPAKAEVAPEYTIKFNSYDGNGIYI